MDDLLSSLEEASRQGHAALVDAERQYAQLEVRVQALRTEVAGIEAALQRRKARTPDPLSLSKGNPHEYKSVAGSVLPGSPTAAGVAAIVLVLMELHGSWVNKKRAGVVESVLKVAGGPIHRGDIAEALVRLGRSDTLESVSAALAYLNRSGRAHPVGDGFWAVGIVPNIQPAEGGELKQ